jgi:hypothetical protein
VKLDCGENPRHRCDAAYFNRGNTGQRHISTRVGLAQSNDSHAKTVVVHVRTNVGNGIGSDAHEV